MIEQVGMGVIVLFLILDWMAWKSNRDSDRNWERMRRELTPTNYGESSISWKTFYSKRLMEGLYPALSDAKSFEDGYYHALTSTTYPMIFKVPQ